jgi:hypothetical protein
MKKDNASPENNETGSMDTEAETLLDSCSQETEFDSVDTQDYTRVIPDRGGTEFVPLVAEINEELNRLHGRMHGLGCSRRRNRKYMVCMTRSRRGSVI